MLYDFDVGSMNVFVGRNKVRRQDGSKEFWRVDWMLLGHDVRRLFHCIGRDHDAVISLCIASICYSQFLVDTRRLEGILTQIQSRLQA